MGELDRALKTKHFNKKSLAHQVSLSFKLMRRIIKLNRFWLLFLPLEPFSTQRYLQKKLPIYSGNQQGVVQGVSDSGPEAGSSTHLFLALADLPISPNYCAGQSHPGSATPVDFTPRFLGRCDRLARQLGATGGT